MRKSGADAITTTAPVAEHFPDLAAIAAGDNGVISARFRRAKPIGRPIGDAAFTEAPQRRTGRTMGP